MCSDSLSHVKRGSIRVTEVLPHQHPLSWWNSCSRSQSFSSSLAVQSCAAPHRGRVQLQDTCSLLQLLCTIPETSQERLVPYLSPFMCLDYSVFWTSILPLFSSLQKHMNEREKNPLGAAKLSQILQKDYTGRSISHFCQRSFKNMFK